MKFLGIIFNSKLTFQKHFEEILGSCNTKYHHARLIVNKNGDPACAPYYKLTNNVSGQFSNMAHFRPQQHRTQSSAKFNGSRTSLSDLPCIYHCNNNKKRSHTQLDSRKQVIAFQDRVITINIKEAQHPLK